MNFAARRKLAVILKSKATKEIPLTVAEFVEVYQKTNKKGTWSQPKQILSINEEGKFITVPGKKGSKITVAIEDVRKSVKENDLSQLVSDGIDMIDQEISEQVDENANGEDERSTVENSEHQEDNSEEIDFNHHNMNLSHDDGPEYGSSDNEECSLPDVCDDISVYWPMDQEFYDGAVHSINDENMYTFYYNDLDIEELDLHQENWKFQENGQLATANSNLS